MQKANELVQVLQTCSQESSAKRYKPTLDNFAETINKDINLIEKGNTSQEKEVIILSRQGQLSEKWKALTSEFKASSREADERLTKPYRDLISKGEIKLDPESLEYNTQLRNFMSERVGMVGQTLIDIAKKLEQGKAAGMKPEEFFATCDADFKQLHLSIISSLNTQGWLFVGTRNALARALGKVDKRLESDIAGQQQIATLLMPSRPYGACEHAFGSLIENLDKIFPRKYLKTVTETFFKDFEKEVLADLAKRSDNISSRERLELAMQAFKPMEPVSNKQMRTPEQMKTVLGAWNAVQENWKAFRDQLRPIIPPEIRPRL
jgi:hypothetical protein